MSNEHSALSRGVPCSHPGRLSKNRTSASETGAGGLFFENEKNKLAYKRSENFNGYLAGTRCGQYIGTGESVISPERSPNLNNKSME
jgi:hypothetical protein